MDNPGTTHLTEMVRKINEIGRRARSGASSVDEYLRNVASDPTTEWFTELLSEKNAELETERQRADQVARTVQAWYDTRQAGTSDGSANAADLQLIDTLRVMGIIDP